MAYNVWMETVEHDLQGASSVTAVQRLKTTLYSRMRYNVIFERGLRADVADKIYNGVVVPLVTARIIELQRPIAGPGLVMTRDLDWNGQFPPHDGSYWV